MRLRVLLADLLRGDDSRCVDCGEERGSTWVRTWRMTVRRPWTYLLPEVERRCYDCGIDHDIEQHVEEDSDR